MDIVLNEVLYDPAGADGGYEFVELAAAPGADPAASLDGWRLETANGADGTWRLAWIGAAGDRLGGGRFVVGESGVEPPPDAVRTLDLQNGPDACRLVSPGGAQDVLGWGVPLPAALFEGSPAADPSSGESLARRPDGRDTGINSQDFVASPPSPGEFNSPEHALLVEEFEPPPEGHPVGVAWSFRWIVRNVGRAAWSGAVRAECAVHPGESLAEASPDMALPSGARMALEARVPPPPGAHLPRSSPPSVVSAPVWLGGGRDVEITEVYSRPPPDESEWVELRVVGARAVDLAAFRMEDAAGTGASLSGHVPAGGRVLLAADTAAVVSRWNPPAPVRAASPWPALNHTGSGIAERVVLLVAGTPVAAASLPGGIAEGVSWERTAIALDGDRPDAWGPSLDPSGATPGRENSRRGDRVVARVAGAVSAQPSPFLPSRDGTVLVVVRPVRVAADCRVELFDSAGRRVARLAVWRHAEREHRAAWDGRTEAGEKAPLGLYLACAEVGNVRLPPALLVLAE